MTNEPKIITCPCCEQELTHVDVCLQEQHLARVSQLPEEEQGKQKARVECLCVYCREEEER